MAKAANNEGEPMDVILQIRVSRSRNETYKRFARGREQTVSEWARKTLDREITAQMMKMPIAVEMADDYRTFKGDVMKIADKHQVPANIVSKVIWHLLEADRKLVRRREKEGTE